MIKKVVSIFKNRAFYVTLLIALFLTSALIIAAMWLGQESGNFVIRIQDETNTRTIALSDSDDPTDATQYVTSLTTDGIGNFHDTTLRYFLTKDKLSSDITSLTENVGVNEDVIETKDEDGNVIQASLYCYTFYIINTSSSAFPVNIEMTYSNVTKDLDEAIRVLTYSQSTNDINIYQKADSEEYDYINGKAGYFIDAQTFSSNSVVYTESLTLGQDEAATDANAKYAKYSVMFWLEGYDPDCDESILGGSIKFKLNISVQG